MKQRQLMILRRVLSDPLRKNLLQFLGELVALTIKNRRLTQEYFSRFAYRKGFLSLSNYTSDYDIGKLRTSLIVHSEQSMELLKNKLAFYYFCEAHQIPTPKVLAYTKDKQFYNVKHEALDIDQAHFREVLHNWIMTSKNKSVFAKPLALIQGIGAFKIDESNWDDEVLLHSLYTAIKLRDYIIQETIVQHESIDKINHASINTVRIDTYKPINEPSRVLSAVMRFGREGFVVDNPESSSGFYISLDLENQCLKGPGFQTIYIGTDVYDVHPDSQVKLDGYPIPFVDETIELVNRVCELSGDRLVGWDICIGKEGPILIEGNHDYDILMQEVAYGGYLNHPDFVRALAEEDIHYSK